MGKYVNFLFFILLHWPGANQACGLKYIKEISGKKISITFILPDNLERIMLRTCCQELFQANSISHRLSSPETGLGSSDPHLCLRIYFDCPTTSGFSDKPGLFYVRSVCYSPVTYNSACHIDVCILYLCFV